MNQLQFTTAKFVSNIFYQYPKQVSSIIYEVTHDFLDCGLFDTSNRVQVVKQWMEYESGKHKPKNFVIKSSKHDVKHWRKMEWIFNGHVDNVY